MKCLRPVLLIALTSLTSALNATTPAPYVWTGLGTNWRGQVTPNLSDGSADLWFDEGVSDFIPIAQNLDLNSVRIADYASIWFKATNGPVTLTLRSGITTEENTEHVGATGQLFIGKEITLDLSHGPTINLGYGNTLAHYGALTGTAPVSVTSIGPSVLSLRNISGNASTYSGTLTINSGSFLTLWNSHSLGSGALVFANGGRLTTFNDLTTLPNNLTLNTTGAGKMTFSPRDGALTVTGNVTLADNATIEVETSGAHTNLDLGNAPATVATQGPKPRNPVVLSGNLAETGGARSLTVMGRGPLILTGTNTFSGGTRVTGNSSASGALVFGSFASIPTTGTIQAGDASTSNAPGYVGIAASALGTNTGVNDFAAFADKISATSSGAVGIDTLPSESVTPFSGAIDLTHFTSGSATGIRLGSATKAIVSGTITPQKNTYAFGNGGGVLTVRTNLTNNPTTEATRNLNLYSNGTTPLGLVLQGTNSYSGGTFVGTGYLVFDGNGALTNSIPLLGSLTAGGSQITVGASYIGYTDKVASNVIAEVASAIGATEFLSKFDKTNTWGVIGFDSSNPASPVAISNVDLTGFNDGVFLGTVTAATLKGTLTPTTVANGNNPANTLRFTAGVGGTLTVQSQLADLSGGTAPLQVIVGSPSSQTLADGTVVFDPRNSDNISVANTYSGGTYVNTVGGITLAATRNDAFGTGTITLQPQGGIVGLQALASGLVIGNDIAFGTPVSQSIASSATLAPTGSNDFTLSGALSGRGNFQLVSPQNSTPLNVTLSGDNSAFDGTFQLWNGTLTAASNHATGQATVDFYGNATLALGGSATSLTLHGLSGERGAIVLPNATNLTINLDNTEYDHDFGGTISGAAGAVTTASLAVTNTSSATDGTHIVYLYGNNNYSGGTTISGDGAALALGHNNAAGTGLVTVNVTEGGLLLNTGITFTNRLQFNQGALAGFGTFAPTEINGDSSATRRFTIGANQLLLPGFPGDGDGLPGTLTLAHSVTFTAGGTLLWILQDAFRSDGYSALSINGDLDLTSLTSTSRFTIALESLDSYGANGFASMTIGDTYTFAILSASGTIQGFDPTKFTIDSSKFQQNAIDPSTFALATSADGKQLLLSFTAVPEPGTYALLGLGLALVALAARRRRP